MEELRKFTMINPTGLIKNLQGASQLGEWIVPEIDLKQTSSLRRGIGRLFWNRPIESKGSATVSLGIEGTENIRNVGRIILKKGYLIDQDERVPYEMLDLVYSGPSNRLFGHRDTAEIKLETYFKKSNVETKRKDIGEYCSEIDLSNEIPTGWFLFEEALRRLR
jgi:hypothetical protein